jgi:hypothetical protein
MNAARSIFATPGGTTAVGPAPLTTPPFPARYSNPFRSDPKLQGALDDAIATGPGTDWRTPVCVVSLSPTDGRYPVAAFRPDEVHYSASLVKVAALYAAFELRNTLRAIAQELGASATASNVLRKAASYLNPRIMGKVAEISPLRGVAQRHAVPQYDAAFKATSASSGVTVDFSSSFTHHATKMITESNNSSAGKCVHASGYGYLNGALASAGFLDLVSLDGIWLAGDYSHEYPKYTVDSVNDKQVGQAATVLQLAKMYTLMFDRSLVEAASSSEMLDFLAGPVNEPPGRREVFIDQASDLDFVVTQTKVGLGPLKSGIDVYSEASIVQHNSGGSFVATWQNFVWGDDGFDSIGHVVRDTIDAYLTS